VIVRFTRNIQIFHRCGAALRHGHDKVGLEGVAVWRRPRGNVLVSAKRDHLFFSRQMPAALPFFEDMTYVIVKQSHVTIPAWKRFRAVFLGAAGTFDIDFSLRKGAKPRNPGININQRTPTLLDGAQIATRQFDVSASPGHTGTFRPSRNRFELWYDSVIRVPHSSKSYL
jgi:hypothetical protein